MTGVTQTRPRPQYVVVSPVQPRWNGMAIVAFVVVFFASVVGLVLGYVALSQVKRTDERGRGLAIAAVILGWIGSVGALLVAGLLIIGTVVLKLY